VSLKKILKKLKKIFHIKSFRIFHQFFKISQDFFKNFSGLYKTWNGMECNGVEWNGIWSIPFKILKHGMEN
jgi:hypothetical protein